MPRLEPHSRTASFASLAQMLCAWIAGGALVLLLLPAPAWHNHYIGSLPYWLLAAPMISLALLRRQPIVAALSAFLVRGRRRRNPGARRRGARASSASALRTRYSPPGREARLHG